MYCRNCGQEMNDNQSICLGCGVKKDVGNSFCPTCGKPVMPEAAVCLNCGVSLAASSSLGGKDKITIAVLCLFLGGLGVHNFLMGENKKGVLKIILTLCCGIGFIFAIVDFIKILLDKYEADPEKLI